jgi:hypothetical protein
MQVDATQVQEVVRTWVAEAEASASGQPMTIKRGEIRYDWPCSIQLLVGDQTHYVYSRDISTKGIGLTFRHELPEGTIVYVKRDEQDPWIPARVMHCTATVGSHKVGLAFAFDV